MKLWGGRFTEQTDKLVETFNASITFDYRLYPYDIKGSKVHVKMLAKTGIITTGEAEIIINGLDQVKKDFEKDKFKLDPSLEDIHTLVETKLFEKVGPVAGKLHTARSRNDQVALDVRLYLKDQLIVLKELLINFMSIILKLGNEYKDTIMPGYTHLQRAQPITFGHHLLAYYFKLKRDLERLEDNFKRINILPLGSGALAGTSFPIDREWVADELGFDKISNNSLDGVSDRDFIIEFLSVASTIMMHLSRFSEELILWSSSEFDFIEISDAYSTGSSIMPQKKNPDVAELVRGKTGRVYGNLIQLLTTLKGLPLAYNKDMQEDKESLFDTVDTLKIILDIFPQMLSTIKVKKENMFNAASSGYLNATELANFLVQKGISFRKAHEIVGRVVLFSLDKGKELTDLSINEWKELVPDMEEKYIKEVVKVLDVKNCIINSRSKGGPAPAETVRVIETEYKWLDSKIKLAKDN